MYPEKWKRNRRSKTVITDSCAEWKSERASRKKIKQEVNIQDRWQTYSKIGTGTVVTRQEYRFIDVQNDTEKEAKEERL